MSKAIIDKDTITIPVLTQVEADVLDFLSANEHKPGKIIAEGVRSIIKRGRA